MNNERTKVPATTGTSLTTGKAMEPPVKLEFQFLHQKGMTWLLIGYESYGRERNLIQDISVHGLPVDIPELRTKDKALFDQIDAAMDNNAGTYWDDQAETEVISQRVQEGPTMQELDDNTRQTNSCGVTGTIQGYACEVKVNTVRPEGSPLTIDHSAPQVENLMDGIIREMNRIRWIQKEYERLPGGAGAIGIALMKAYIIRTEKAIKDSNTVDMLVCYELLKECEPDMQEEVLDHA